MPHCLSFEFLNKGRCLLQGVRVANGKLAYTFNGSVDRIEAKTGLHEVLHFLPLRQVFGFWRSKLSAEHFHRTTALRAISFRETHRVLERFAADKAHERKSEMLHSLRFREVLVMLEVRHALLPFNDSAQRAAKPSAGAIC
jgi:hypothetical protein